MSKKKVGIALGGGAARGIAHVGVLEILEKEGIPIDIVAGTSAGAVIGALHASGMTALQMKELFLGFDWKKRRRLVDISVPHTGFIAGERLMHEMQKIMGGDIKFNELKKPFACVACDLLSGEEIVMTMGSVAEAVHASISIPVVFQAVKRKGRFLIDGGLVNQVPVNVVKAMGADYIIAVNVVPRHVQKLKARLDDQGTSETESGPRPNLISVMLSVIDIANSCRIETCFSGADIVIEPRMLQIGPADFHKAELSILQGEMAAIDAVLKIKRELSKN
ncbi:MAG: patatin family protein [Dehalococcoidia bacterium]|nr:MAG: patatin family protein [Dehalococcoidia bacterium]